MGFGNRRRGGTGEREVCTQERGGHGQKAAATPFFIRAVVVKTEATAQDDLQYESFFGCISASVRGLW